MKQFRLNIAFLLSKFNIDNNLVAKNKLKKIIFNGKRIDVKTAYKLSLAFGYSIEDLLTINIPEKYEKAKKMDLKFLVTDIDGVLTDGGIYITAAGDEFKKFNVKDGLGIVELIKEGFQVGFLSAGLNPSIVERRAKMLGVQNVYIGKESKINILRQWCDKLQISLDNVAYIGDDIKDLEVIQNVGLSACPIDAVKSVKSAVDIILPSKGGEACLRQFIDEFLNITGH